MGTTTETASGTNTTGDPGSVRAAHPDELWEVYSHGIRHFREYHTTEASAEKVARILKDNSYSAFVTKLTPEQIKTILVAR